MVGCGIVSPQHLRHLRGNKETEIVGVCDIDEARRREAAERFGIRNVFPHLAGMLEQVRPDVIHVLTPPQTHKDLSIQAISAGCHVLVEKPMAIDVREADEMIAAAHANRVVLGVCHNRVFNDPLVRAKRLVARGEIGRLVSVEIFCGRPFVPHAIQRWHAWQRELPGSVFHESLPHLVYLLMEFVNPVRVVAARSQGVERDPSLPAKELRVLLTGDSVLASLCLSTASQPFRFYMIIHGTEKTLTLDLATNVLITLRGDPRGKFSKAWVNVDHGCQLLLETLFNVARTLGRRQRRSHATLIRKFYQSLRHGTEPPVTADEGRAVVAVLDRIWEDLAPERLGVSRY